MDKRSPHTEGITKENYKDFLGENTSKLSEKDRKLVYKYLMADKKDKGGKGNYTPEGIKKMPPISREMAKGGEVKGYKKGGSVHKNKKNMITTKGWGASRKT